MLFKDGLPINLSGPLDTVSKVSFACGFETVNSGGRTGKTKTSSLLFTLKIISNKKTPPFFRKVLKKTIDKTENVVYNVNRKRQDLKRLCRQTINFYNNRLARGGYCAFMGNNIIKMIIAKTT